MKCILIDFCNCCRFTSISSLVFIDLRRFFLEYLTILQSICGHSDVF